MGKPLQPLETNLFKIGHIFNFLLMGYLVHCYHLGKGFCNFDQLHQWQSVKALATLLIYG